MLSYIYMHSRSVWYNSLKMECLGFCHVPFKMKYFGILKLVIGEFVVRASASKSQCRLQFIKTDGKKSLSSCQGNSDDSNNGPKCEEVQV